MIFKGLVHAAGDWSDVSEVGSVKAPVSILLFLFDYLVDVGSVFGEKGHDLLNE